MLRSVFIFKLLVLSLISNLLCLIYIIFQKSQLQVIVQPKEHDFSVKEFHSSSERDLSRPSLRLLPIPHQVTQHDGRTSISDGFHLAADCQISSSELDGAIKRYEKYISSAARIQTRPFTSRSTRSPNQLLLECASINFKQLDPYPTMGEDESYQLRVESKGAVLSASTITGFIRGLATFVQLIEVDPRNKQSFVPHVIIEDKARFVWRGLMLDVCRHWMPREVIERTLNAMELSKMNVLHLHLSDDQGFRLESHQYPLLHDRQFYYTHKEMKELVEYARQRRIRIVPEFDIPGHTTR
jgi:hexosaminidase